MAEFNVILKESTRNGFAGGIHILEFEEFRIRIYRLGGAQVKSFHVYYREQVASVEYHEGNVILYTGVGDRTVISCYVSSYDGSTLDDPVQSLRLAKTLKRFVSESPLTHQLKKDKSKLFDELESQTKYAKGINPSYWKSLADLDVKNSSDIESMDIDSLYSSLLNNFQKAVAMSCMGDVKCENYFSWCYHAFKRFSMLDEPGDNLRLFAVQWLLRNHWDYALVERAVSIIKKEILDLVYRSESKFLQSYTRRIWNADFTPSVLEKKKGGPEDELFYQWSFIEKLLHFLRLGIICGSFEDLPRVQKVLKEQLTNLESKAGGLKEYDEDSKSSLMLRINRYNLELKIYSGINDLERLKTGNIDKLVNNIALMFKYFVNPPGRKNSMLSLIEELEWTILKKVFFHRYLGMLDDKKGTEVVRIFLG